MQCTWIVFIVYLKCGVSRRSKVTLWRSKVTFKVTPYHIRCCTVPVLCWLMIMRYKFIVFIFYLQFGVSWRSKVTLWRSKITIKVTAYHIRCCRVPLVWINDNAICYTNLSWINENQCKLIVFIFYLQIRVSRRSKVTLWRSKVSFKVTTYHIRCCRVHLLWKRILGTEETRPPCHAHSYW